MNSHVAKTRLLGVSLLWLVCGICTSILAQESAISRKEFDRVELIYKGFLEKEPYRIRSTHESYPSVDAKEPETTNVWMTEFVQPFREHNYYGLNSSDPTTKYERIVIAPRIFVGKDGNWTELERSRGGFGFSLAAASVEYFIRSSEKIGDRMTTIYEVITGSEFPRGAASKEISLTSEKYWISKDGRIRKSVGESDVLKTKRNRLTQIYEYDPTIKIEAPIK
jgi:hypothetical protein